MSELEIPFRRHRGRLRGAAARLVPAHSLTILVEALIFGLFAMSLDLMVGLLPALFVRPRRRLRARRLFVRADPHPRAAAAAGRHPAGGRGHHRDRGADRLGLHALDRRVVRDADARLRAAPLCHAVPVPRRHRRLRRPGRHPAPCRAVRHRLVPGQARLLLSRARLPARLLPPVPRHRALAVRRGARGIRENEAKTIALGYNTRPYKIAIVVLAYGFGGLAGALYAPFAASLTRAVLLAALGPRARSW